MLRAEHFLANLQSLLVKRFSFGVPAHIFVELREIVEACRRVRMFHGLCILIAVRLPGQGNQLFGQRNRLFIFPLVFELLNLPI